MYDYMGEIFVGASRNITLAAGPPFASGLTLIGYLSKDGGSFSTHTITYTDLGNGWYKAALTATQTDTIGDLAMRFTATGAADDYYAKAIVIGQNLFSTTPLDVDVIQWVGTTVTTPASVGIPDVNVKNWANFAAATTQQAISTTAGSSSTNVNVVSWAGFSTATTQDAIATTTATAANVAQWAGFTAATTQTAIATTAAVNVIQWATFAAATTQSAIATTPAVNVIQWATNSVASTPAVNAVQWAGFTTATTQNAISTTTATAVNVAQWAGFNTATNQDAIATTTATAANVAQWAGFAAATTQSAIATTPAVNVIQWATNSVASTPAVNAVQWAGFAAATTQTPVFAPPANFGAMLITATGGVTTNTFSTAAITSAWQYIVDGTVTAEQSLRLANSANGGILSGATTTAILIRDLGNTKDRITASGDAVGNRTAVTLDLT